MTTTAAPQTSRLDPYRVSLSEEQERDLATWYAYACYRDRPLSAEKIASWIDATCHDLGLSQNTVVQFFHGVVMAAQLDHQPWQAQGTYPPASDLPAICLQIAKHEMGPGFADFHRQLTYFGRICREHHLARIYVLAFVTQHLVPDWIEKTQRDPQLIIDDASYFASRAYY